MFTRAHVRSFRSKSVSNRKMRNKGSKGKRHKRHIRARSFVRSLAFSLRGYSKQYASRRVD